MSRNKTMNGQNDSCAENSNIDTPAWTPELLENPDLFKILGEKLEAFEAMRTPKNPFDFGFACVGLHNPITMGNVGSVLRAAGCFGASMIAMTGGKYKKAATDTNHQYRQTPFLLVDDLHDVVPYSCVPVAVELIPGAKNILDYEHPRRAFYVFGGEQETLGKKVLSWCRDVVYIPTNYSLNLAVCVNVVLFDRMMKLLKASENGEKGRHRSDYKKKEKPGIEA